MNNESSPIEAEIVEPSNLPALNFDRAEIDVQIATAHRYPRSMELFKKRALEKITIDKETAASCLYRRPVGKDPDTGKQKIVEGESIRLAEIVLASYGNCRSASYVIEMTPRYVKARGIAHDLETNNAFSGEVVESTVDKNGKPYTERQRALVAKVACAKAQRDAAFKIVPKALCRSLIDAAKRVAIGDATTLEKSRASVMEWIGTLTSNGKKLELARVFSTLEVNGVSDIGLSELEILTGLWTAIKDGDTTVDEAFPHLNASRDEGKSKTQSLADKLKSKTEQKEPGQDG